MPRLWYLGDSLRLEGEAHLAKLPGSLKGSVEVSGAVAEAAPLLVPRDEGDEDQVSLRDRDGAEVPRHWLWYVERPGDELVVERVDLGEAQRL